MIKNLFLVFLFTAASHGPVLAGPAEQDAVRVHCESDLNVPPGTCDCLAGKTGEMSEGQQRLLAAMLTSDEATAAGLRAELAVQETVEVATFHLHQVPACAGG